MRVSDVERQRTVDELKRHCAAGRIDMDEYGVRIEKAMSCATLADLYEVTADLPMIRIADPVGTRPRTVVDGYAGPNPFGDSQLDLLVKAKLASTLILAFSVVAVMAAAGIGLAESWGWSLVVLAVWLVGVGQGLLIHSMRTGRRR